MATILLDRTPHTIESLPYGVVSTSERPDPRCAVAIGNHVIDLLEYSRAGALSQLKNMGRSFEEIFAQVGDEESNIVAKRGS
jgi:fumarylacetoacetase